MTQDVSAQTGQGPGGRCAARRVGRLLFSQRARALEVWAVAGFVLFAVCRAALLAAYRGELQDVTAREIVRCFLVGMQFDAFPLGAAGIPLALALAVAPNLAFPLKWFRRAITAYVVAMLVGLLFLEIVGLFFFFQFDFRMNWIAIDYLQFPRETIGYIWDQYPVAWVFLGLGLLVAGLYWALGRIIWSGPAPTAPIWPRPILALFLCGLCVMGIRGSFDRKPLHIGRAYLVSNNSIVGQATLNNVYSLVAAATTEWANNQAAPQDYGFPPVKRMDQVVHDLYYQPQDTDLGAPGNPLWRRTATGRPMADYNVVVILAESLSGKRVGALGYAPSYTPALDALCKEGLFFDHMYAAGMRTNRALVGVLCGYPDSSVRSIMIQSRAQGRFLTLPGFFRERGYKTLFVYGGRNTWDNTKGFFVDGGQIEEFIGQDDVRDAAEVNPWGVSDEVTFRKAHQRFLSYGDHKFFGAILTITNHEPFNYPTVDGLAYEPGDSLEVHKNNCCRYADWAIGRFLGWAREAPYFKKTIFVIVADHGREFNAERYLDIPGYRVPCVIYAPGIVPPGRISTVASQTDIAPTVLALLGGQFDHSFFGRNLLAVRPEDGFAFMYANEVIAFTCGGRGLVLLPRHDPMLFRVTETQQEALPQDRAVAEIPALREKALSVYGTTLRLYREVRYCLPEQAATVLRRGE